MEIVYEKSALKSLRRMQPKRRAIIMATLKAIAGDPFASQGNVKRKKGRKDTFIYRAGDFRAVYRIDRVAQVMRVELVKPRGEVY